MATVKTLEEKDLERLSLAALKLSQAKLDVAAAEVEVKRIELELRARYRVSGFEVFDSNTGEILKTLNGQVVPPGE